MTTAKSKLPAPSEAEIQKTCLALLKARGVLCWRNNTGALVAGSGPARRFVRFGDRGSSDIIGVLPDGRFLAVEVKRPGNRPTEPQIAFMVAVAERGGAATWVDSAAKLDRWLDEILDGKE